MYIQIISENNDLAELLSQHGDGRQFKTIPDVSELVDGVVISYKLVDVEPGRLIRIVDAPSGGDGREVVRPYYLRDLLGEIEAAAQNPDDEVEVGVFLFNAASGLLKTDSEDIELTDKEVGIISSLINALPDSVSKKDLLSDVWGYGSDVDTHTLETHIYRLRKKLGDGRDFIITDKDGYKI